MTTSVHELALTISERLNEVGLLLEKAEEYRDNESLYGALCRSSTVLLVAHFEGFIKDMAKAFIDDLNSYVPFDALPSSLKRTYCAQFISGDDQANNEKKIQKLIEVFDSLDTKLKVDPFLFENNKNPSPSMMEKICKNFGVNNFFKMIENSRLDEVFSENRSETNAILIDLKEHVLLTVGNYPYSSNPDVFGISLSNSSVGLRRTLWQTFLDELLKNRHSIAHGSSLLNTQSSEEIDTQKTKLEILQYAVILIMTRCIR